MNCDEFGQRMNQSLDDRMTIDSDSELCRHAKQCESCRAQMHAWSQIASIMPGRTAEPTAKLVGNGRTRKDFSGTMWALTGLAATILIAVTWFWDTTDPTAVVVDSSRGQLDSVGLNDRGMVLAQAAGELDPAGWWRSVQDRDWVSQTMPAVQSVKDGVAPIGRSLMRAVTILTMGGDDQTS